MSCNIHTCRICYIVKLVTNQVREAAMPADTGKKLFVGPRFRRIRQQLGLSQTQIAEGLGISPSYINLIERNQRPVTAQIRSETFRRPPFPANSPAIGAVADPDCRGTRHFSELYQPDRAQPAPGDGTDQIGNFSAAPVSGEFASNWGCRRPRLPRDSAFLRAIST